MCTMPPVWAAGLWPEKAIVVPGSPLGTERLVLRMLAEAA